MFFVIRPIPHGPDLPVPEPDVDMKYSFDSEHSHMTVVTRNDAYKQEDDDQLVPLTQAELNNVTRDLNCWVHVSKRNICWHQEQRSTGIETVRVN